MAQIIILYWLITGGQCEDPGYPVDGYTTFTSYDHGRTVVYTLEENSVATFHCNRAGYSPVPHDTIICQAVGDGQLAWSDRVPKCQGGYTSQKDVHTESKAISCIQTFLWKWLIHCLLLLPLCIGVLCLVPCFLSRS